jgi:hypothetical protein
LGNCGQDSADDGCAAVDVEFEEVFARHGFRGRKVEDQGAGVKD